MTKPILNILFVLLVLQAFSACKPKPAAEKDNPPQIDIVIETMPETRPETERSYYNTADSIMLAHGLVDIHALDPRIAINLKYATEDNFTKIKLYDFQYAYALPVVAQHLSQAQDILDEQYPGHRLLVFDCARPQSAQYKMWEVVKGSELQRYVAEPGPGSNHNFGAAVDVSLLDSLGNEVDMGTPFDYFGPEAQTRYHWEMLQDGRLSQQQIDNRNLLKSVMKAAGFWPIQTEWWHYNLYNKEYVRATFQIIP